MSEIETSTMAPKSLAAYLKATRTSGRSFARKVGISQSYLSLLLKGDRHPSGKIALKLARESGVPIERVLAGPAPRRRRGDDEETH